MIPSSKLTKKTSESPYNSLYLEILAKSKGISIEQAAKENKDYLNIYSHGFSWKSISKNIRMDNPLHRRKDN